jgi:hypothetical protein
VLLEPRFQQPSQLSEALRQLPACQRSRLVESACLLLQQRQAVQRIEDQFLALVAARVPGDDFTAAADRDVIHIALHQHFAVSIRGWRRVVVGAVANQRQRVDPRHLLLAGFMGRRGQRQQHCPVPFKALADRLLVPAQPPLPPLAAIFFQVHVQLVPTVHTRNRHQEVAPHIAHQPLDLALVVTLGWTPELLRQQVVTLHFGEGPRLLPLAVAQDLGHGDLRVVVENLARHSTEIGKGPHVAFEKSLCGLGRKRRHETVIGVRQIHRQVVRLPLHSGDNHQRLAEVRLRFSGSMPQRHEHLLRPQPLRAHIVLHDSVAAGERVLGPQPLKYPLRRVPLPGRPPLVFFQNRVDRAQPRPQLRTLHRLLTLVPGRHRVAKHLPHRLPRYPKLQGDRTLTPALNPHRTPHTTVKLHLEHPSGVP